LVEKWPGKLSMWAHFRSLRWANSGSSPSSQQVRIIRRTCRATGSRVSGRAYPVPSQAVQGSGAPWGRRVAPRPVAGAAEEGVIEGAGGVGGLGGVLRHVGGHGLVGEFGVGAEGGDLAHVELFAPGEFAFPDRIRLDRDADPCGGGPGGLGEYSDGGVRRWGLVVAVGGRRVG